MMLKDLLYALELGVRIIMTFILCSYVGYQLDVYFQTSPLLIMVGILISFVIVMKILLGVGKHE